MVEAELGGLGEDLAGWRPAPEEWCRDARIDRQHTPIHAGICQQYVPRSWDGTHAFGDIDTIG
jgi:hypothetical protein